MKIPPLHRRQNKYTILRNTKSENLFEHYVQLFDVFVNVLGDTIPKEKIHSEFDEWYNATYLKTTKSGRAIWKIK